ncbi:MAG: thiamine biosynthesis protein ThiS [Cyanobium sp. M30B3]|nr:MAG: thiamine biosynthesis protein ThiS [Cyanobium sp. M30B3]
MDPNAESAALAIQVNGETRTCPAGLNLEQALAALGFQPRLVVVELNGTILPRQRWPQQPVQESDCLEVVTIVGGGS